MCPIPPDYWKFLGARQLDWSDNEVAYNMNVTCSKVELLSLIHTSSFLLFNPAGLNKKRKLTAQEEPLC